jgi:hypothetical protein
MAPLLGREVVTGEGYFVKGGKRENESCADGVLLADPGGDPDRGQADAGRSDPGGAALVKIPGQLTVEQAAELGYFPARIMPSGECAGIRRMIFTWSLCLGLDECGFRTRFCYDDGGDAIIALATWDGAGDPPGNWIKEKGYGERTNPNYKPSGESSL